MSALADHDDWLGQPYSTPAAPLPFYGPRNALPGIERPYTPAELLMIARGRERALWSAVHRLEAFIESKGLSAELNAYQGDVDV